MGGIKRVVAEKKPAQNGLKAYKQYTYLKLFDSSTFSALHNQLEVFFFV
jgi:hypothetical protein